MSNFLNQNPSDTVEPIVELLPPKMVEPSISNETMKKIAETLEQILHLPGGQWPSDKKATIYLAYVMVPEIKIEITKI